MICVGAFLLAVIILALARLRWVKWCPACGGNGWETYEGGAGPCTACGGRGVLRVPDSPAALEHRELDETSHQWERP
jgi:hypothetical protein